MSSSEIDSDSDSTSESESVPESESESGSESEGEQGPDCMWVAADYDEPGVLIWGAPGGCEALPGNWRCVYPNRSPAYAGEQFVSYCVPMD